MSNGLENISIIIVTYKNDDLTRNCLDSLATTCGDAPQIVVVDNSPSASTRDIVSRYANTLYVASPGNPGFAGGNNRAIPFCNRPYILLLNNDTIVHTDESLAKLVEFLDKNPKCAAVQGRGRLPSVRNTLAGCGCFLTPYGVLWTTGFMTNEEPNFDKPHPCFAVGGFFLMFRRSVLPSVGGRPFKTHFWCYYEEIDFCHRLWLSGHEVWYVPTPPIDHLLSRTSSNFRHNDVMRRYLRNVIFSLSANLSAWNRFRILNAFRFLLVGHALASLLRGKMSAAKCNIAAIIWAWHDRMRILAARRQIKKLRKATDQEIFAKTMYRPNPTEFFKSIVSRI